MENIPPTPFQNSRNRGLKARPAVASHKIAPIGSARVMPSRMSPRQTPKLRTSHA